MPNTSNHLHGEGLTQPEKETGRTPRHDPHHIIIDTVHYASTTPKPRKRKESGGSASTRAHGPEADPFSDLPGAGDIDWLGA